VALYPACTFGSLASYTVTLCNAKGAPDEQYADAGGKLPDPCDVLNQADPTSCTPWQCDVATSTCVQKKRDDDHDGDPPVACGGGDCDDTDPQLNSLHVDPGTTQGSFQGNGSTAPTLSSDGITPVVADINNVMSGCLVGGDAESSPRPCAVSTGLRAGGLAAPFGAVDGSAFVFAFATNPTSGCSSSELGIAYESSSNSAATPVYSMDCATSGVALPAVTVVTPGSNGQVAVAYYETPTAPACSASATTPFAVSVENLGGSNLLSTAGATLTMTASSIRPPAMSLRSSVLFVASPDGAAASLWALDPIHLTPATATPWSLGKLAGARGTAMATRANTDGTTRVAVVSEIGCANQAIHVELVDYDASAHPPTFTSVGDLEISPASSAGQTLPSIAWSPARNHWLVTWAVQGPEVRARFFDDNLQPSDAITVPGPGFAAQALPNGHALLVVPPPNETPTDTLVESHLRCP
jgi:hypothetical protein